jgi:hypothetical protein
MDYPTPHNIHHKDSPEFGYVSKGQVCEQVNALMQAEDSERLFNVSSTKSASRLASMVFNQMTAVVRMRTHSRPDFQDRYIYSAPTVSQGAFYYEAGMLSPEDDLGDLINLDFLNALIEERSHIDGIGSPRFTPKVQPVVESLLTERKKFLGIDRTSNQ